MRTVSQRLEWALSEDGKSIRWLEQELGKEYSYSAVYRFVKGKTKEDPPLSFLRKAAELLRLKDAWLLTGEGEVRRGMMRNTSFHRRLAAAIDGALLEELESFPREAFQVARETTHLFSQRLPSRVADPSNSEEDLLSRAREYVTVLWAPALRVKAKEWHVQVAAVHSHAATLWLGWEAEGDDGAD